MACCSFCMASDVSTASFASPDTLPEIVENALEPALAMTPKAKPPLISVEKSFKDDVAVFMPLTNPAACADRIATRLILSATLSTSFPQELFQTGEPVIWFSVV